MSCVSSSSSSSSSDVPFLSSPFCETLTTALAKKNMRFMNGCAWKAMDIITIALQHPDTIVYVERLPTNKEAWRILDTIENGLLAEQSVTDRNEVMFMFFFGEDYLTIRKATTPTVENVMKWIGVNKDACRSCNTVLTTATSICTKCFAVYCYPCVLCGSSLCTKCGQPLLKKK